MGRWLLAGLYWAIMAWGWWRILEFAMPRLQRAWWRRCRRREPLRAWRDDIGGVIVPLCEYQCFVAAEGEVGIGTFRLRVAGCWLPKAVVMRNMYLWPTRRIMQRYGLKPIDLRQWLDGESGVSS